MFSLRKGVVQLDVVVPPVDPYVRARRPVQVRAVQGNHEVGRGGNAGQREADEVPGVLARGVELRGPGGGGVKECPGVVLQRHHGALDADVPLSGRRVSRIAMSVGVGVGGRLGSSREPVRPWHAGGGGVVRSVHPEVAPTAVVLLADIDDGVAQLMSTVRSVFAPSFDSEILDAYRRTNGPLARDGVITLWLQ